MVQRNILGELKEHWDKREFSLIVGPRQAGKTTLMLLLKEHLEKQGKKTLFLSLDFESDQPFFISQRALTQKIELELGKESGIVFIDEIQRKENAGLFLKGLYDLGLPHKFVISGSGSLELKEKIHESLAGRKRIFELETLSFKEFIHFRTDYHYKERLNQFFRTEKDRTVGLLTEYLGFGGYPRVVLEASLQEKKRVIDDIYRSYLERDISYLLKVEKLEAFSSLIKVLSSQIGRVVNFSELSSTLGISLKTVQNYLWYAEKTFILQRITPFFSNPRKEITKSPIFYFHDLGLRNYAIGLWGNLVTTMDQSFLFQNFVLNLLREKFHYGPEKIHFWRTKDKAEVDFVIETAKELIPIEVKFTSLKKPEVERSFRNFLERYHPRQGWVINLGFKGKIRIAKTEIHFSPYYDLVAE